MWNVIVSVTVLKQKSNYTGQTQIQPSVHVDEIYFLFCQQTDILQLKANSVQTSKIMIRLPITTTKSRSSSTKVLTQYFLLYCQGSFNRILYFGIFL